MKDRLDIITEFRDGACLCAYATYDGDTWDLVGEQICHANLRSEGGYVGVATSLRTKNKEDFDEHYPRPKAEEWWKWLIYGNDSPYRTLIKDDTYILKDEEQRYVGVVWPTLPDEADLCHFLHLLMATRFTQEFPATVDTWYKLRADYDLDPLKAFFLSSYVRWQSPVWYKATDHVHNPFRPEKGISFKALRRAQPTYEYQARSLLGTEVIGGKTVTNTFRTEKVVDVAGIMTKGDGDQDNDVYKGPFANAWATKEDNRCNRALHQKQTYNKINVGAIDWEALP